MFAGSVICCAVALSAVDGRLCAKESLAMAPEPNASARIVRFGTFEADLNARELRKGGVKIKVHGQPFEVLTLLLARPGEVVPREEHSGPTGPTKNRFRFVYFGDAVTSWPTAQAPSG